MIVALDTETYYDDVVSIKTLGTWHYLRHPQADLYLLSVAADNGLRWVGHPKDFDWSQISGPDVTWLSHNVSFDSMVIERLQEIGHAPDNIEISEWICTADMSAYLGHNRSLKESANSLLGVEMTKTVRDNMKGKRWEDMDVFFQDDVVKYALDDAVHCLNLFLQHGDKFVEHEREISAMTRTMCSRGVPLDVPALDKAITKLQTAIWQAKLDIPWADREAILSPLAVRAECEKVGIWAPASFAKGDDEAERWEDEFYHLHPWIKAVRNYRRGNKHLSTLETMRSRCREDGTMPYGLKFFGAHTGRDSGDVGWNAQNLPKGEVFDVDVRSMIKAPEGYTFAIVDLSQIEPRVLHWIAGDTKMLEHIRQCPDFYEAQARAMGLWSGHEPLRTDPQKRHLIKGLNLGLGYGMGAKKFASVANIPSDEAERLTRLYRSKNPLVTKLWKDLEEVLRSTATSKDDKNAEIEMPSGRKMTYRNVSVDHGGLTAQIPRKGKFMRLGFWGGVITENCLSGNTEVLTQRGWIKISVLKLNDRVWDGVEWVTHLGVKEMGIKKTIDCHGIGATEDHLFMTDLGWVEAKIACQTACTDMRYNSYETQYHGSNGKKYREHVSNFFSREQREKQPLEHSLQMWEHGGEDGEGANPKRGAKVLRAILPAQQREGSEHHPRDESACRVCGLEIDEIKVSSENSPSVQELRGPRYFSMSRVVRFIRELLGRYERWLSDGTRLRSNRQRIGVLENKLPLGNTLQKYPEQADRVEEPIGYTRGFFGDSPSARDQEDYTLLQTEEGATLGYDFKHASRPEEPVYDILNCGPRNRFVVRGAEGMPAIIAHNCVQATARDVFMDCCLRIEAQGFPVLMRIHDEVVCLVSAGDEGKRCLDAIVKIMSTAPDWAEGLPLSAEGSLSDVYKK